MLTDKQLKYKSLLEQEEDARIESVFIYFVSTVLQKIKPGTLISIPKRYIDTYQSKKDYFKSISGLEILELTNNNQDTVWYVYDTSFLTEHLQCQGIKDLLEDNEYNNTKCLDTMLQTLTYRFKNSNFPHEVGVFLGYPLEDVKGFIKNKGHNCLACRFWKVYHDVENAMNMFAAIDNAQSTAVTLLTDNLSMNQVIEQLKIN